MIDLHCHLLPGLDDGAETLDEALELAQMAVADGITCCVVTPHLHPGRYENDRESIQLAYENFRSALDENKIVLDLHMAAEARLSIELMPLITEGKVPFLGELNGKKVLLLEFPHSHIPPGTANFITWLDKRGIQALIAHPERNKEIMRDVNKVGALVQQGCLLQLTAASIIGAFGENAKQVAELILHKDWAFVVATDTHNAKHRPPLLGVAYRHIASIWGEPHAQRLCCSNPASLLPLA
jgi:protein-tyrosine phosphatase